MFSSNWTNNLVSIWESRTRYTKGGLTREALRLTLRCQIATSSCVWRLRANKNKGGIGSPLHWNLLSGVVSSSLSTMSEGPLQRAMPARTHQTHLVWDLCQRFLLSECWLCVILTVVIVCIYIFLSLPGSLKPAFTHWESQRRSQLQYKGLAPRALKREERWLLELRSAASFTAKRETRGRALTGGTERWGGWRLPQEWWRGRYRAASWKTRNVAGVKILPDIYLFLKHMANNASYQHKPWR